MQIRVKASSKFEQIFVRVQWLILETPFNVQKISYLCCCARITRKAEKRQRDTLNLLVERVSWLRLTTTQPTFWEQLRGS